jgi:anaerobic selenocysteine-containing dehydrogenase
MYSHQSVRSAIQSTGPVVAPVAERRPVWWMLAQLAARAGHDVLGGVDPDSLTDESYLRSIVERSPLDTDAVFAAGPRGLDLPAEYGWVHEAMLPDGKWRLASPVLVDRLREHREPGPGLLLAPRREMAWSNSVRYGAGTDNTVLRLHPADAAAAGLASGDAATVTSEHGALDVTVEIDEHVRVGVVSLVHGRRGASPGSLLSTRADVDPLTTMPRASGVPVRVEVAPR